MVKFLVDKKRIISIQLATTLKAEGLKWEVVSSTRSPLIEESIDRWIDAYLHKKQPDVSLPIALDGLPPYTTHVLSVLRDIPFGVSLSYKELAEITGSPRGARAVGNACAHNPFLLVIPCHRVLATNGCLGGFAAGLEIKKQLLAFEDIHF